MGLPHITRFFFCMNLENGSRLVGIVHLIVSLSLMVVCSVYANAFRAYVGTVEDAGDHLYTTWYTITTFVAIFTVFHVLLAASLLYGVYKKNTIIVRTWVWVMIVLVVAALVYVVVSMSYGFSSSGSDIFLAFLEGVLFFGILAYCILCVNSFYLMLKSREDMSGPNKTDC